MGSSEPIEVVDISSGSDSELELDATQNSISIVMPSSFPLVDFAAEERAENGGDDKMEELREENRRLRGKVADLEGQLRDATRREKQLKRQVAELQSKTTVNNRTDDDDDDQESNPTETAEDSSTATPAKRVRRLPPRFRDDDDKEEVVKVKRRVKVKGQAQVAIKKLDDGEKKEHAIRPPDPKLDVAEYFCLCGKRFERRQSIQTHVVLKKRGKKFECSACGKGFETHSLLKEHVRGVHKEEYSGPKYSCARCDPVQYFHTWNDYRLHCVEMHKN